MEETKVKNQVEVQALEGESEMQTITRHAMQPTVQSALSVDRLGTANIGKQLDLGALIDELATQVNAVHKGNLDRSEAMLVAQAHTLDAIFHATLRRAANNFGHYPETAERYMKLALKAQAQCRSTLESAATLKSPKANYVAQQNIAHGPQQVNNHLEQQDGERVDDGQAQTPGRNDSEMEAVGVVNRAEDARG